MHVLNHFNRRHMPCFIVLLEQSNDDVYDFFVGLELPFMMMPHPLIPVSLPPASVTMAMSQMNHLSTIANMAAAAQVQSPPSRVETSVIKVIVSHRVVYTYTKTSWSHHRSVFLIPQVILSTKSEKTVNRLWEKSLAVIRTRGTIFRQTRLISSCLLYLLRERNIGSWMICLNFVCAYVWLCACPCVCACGVRDLKVWEREPDVFSEDQKC